MTTDFGINGIAVTMVFIAAMQIWGNRQIKAVKKTANQTHVLVNSQMGITLRSLAEVTAAKAAITRNPADELAAHQAMNSYLDHVAKQAVVDENKGKE